jgi:ParB/RepB/Spo0J family partition protein
MKNRYLKTKAPTMVDLSSIVRDRQAWHTRRYVNSAMIERLKSAILATGHIVPLILARCPEGRLLIVCGLIRLLAAEELGYVEIPAVIFDDINEEHLLLIALTEQETRAPLTTLERGWSLQKLLQFHNERGHDTKPTALGRELGWDKGDVSKALTAARGIPEKTVAAIATRSGCDVADLVSMSRRAAYAIGKASDAGERQRLLEAAATAIAAGQNVTKAVEEARAAQKPCANGSSKKQAGADTKSATKSNNRWPFRQQAFSRLFSVLKRLVSRLRSVFYQAPIT